MRLHVSLSWELRTFMCNKWAGERGPPSVRAYREEPALNGATRFYVGEALVINRL